MCYASHSDSLLLPTMRIKGNCKIKCIWIISADSYVKDIESTRKLVILRMKISRGINNYTERPESIIIITQPYITNYNVEYRDGLKSRGDKIGMPCTHTTVI